MSKRRMDGWQPLAVDHPYSQQAPDAASPVAPEVPEASAVTEKAAVPAPATTEQQSPDAAATEEAAPEVAAQEAAPAQSAEAHDGPIQDPDVPRRRMAGWSALTVANPIRTAVAPAAEAPGIKETSAPDAEQKPEPQTTAQPKRRRMGAPAAAQPETEEAPAEETEPAPARRRMGAAPAAPAASTEELAAKPRRMGAAPAAPAASAEEPATKPRRMGAAPAAPAAEDKPAGGARRMGGAPAAEPAQSAKPVQPAQPAATTSSKPAKEAESEKDSGQRTKIAVGLMILGGVVILGAVAAVFGQWLRTLEPVKDFIETYDGTSASNTSPGMPAWVGWQHFLNFFLMFMIIRSGMTIRHERRPEAYWTAKKGGFYSPSKKSNPPKVSIQQWIHQSANLLWVLNGVIFYVMIFATGHWHRIVPRSWDIFPNMLSAAIQYVSLDWPADNAWLHYNSLQVFAYFLTVFVAAPLAVLSGLRMSSWWPNTGGKLSNLLPSAPMRKLHNVTMIYFVVFILVHLFLVFTTGALANLNMMFTSREATDWWGVGVFLVSLGVTAAVAYFIKPMYVAPVAEKTGDVSSR